jgi:hypothetical protein
MTWRQADDQPLQFALRYFVELVTDDFVMTTQYALGPHMFDELDEVALTLVLHLHLIVSRQKRQGFVLILFTKNLKVFER